MSDKVIKLVREDMYNNTVVEEYHITKKEDKLEVKKITYLVPYLPSEYDLGEMTLDQFAEYLITMYKGEEKDLVYQLLSKLIY